MFPKNFVWLSLLILIIAASMWFVVRSGIELNHYMRLSQTAPAQIESLSLLKEGEDNFAVVLDFSFDANHQKFFGKTALKKKYPNQWAADKSLKDLQKQSWTVWYNPKNPNEATLEKIFPFKSSLSAIILLALFLYFLCLGLYVKMRKA